MACQAIDSWTFTSLIASFLDLAIAYLLLCASTLAFFASKFLSLFGLHLPCPCNGFFGYQNNPKCLQTLLVDLPSSKISTVQVSVRNKFPFDSILMKDPPHHRHHMNGKLLRYGNGSDRWDEREGEASCSSSSEKSDVVRFGSITYHDGMGMGMGKGKGKEKGKGILSERQRPGAIRRRRRSVIDSSPPREITKEENSFLALNSREDDGMQDDKEGQSGNDLSDGTLKSLQLNDFPGEIKNMEKDAFSSLDVGCNIQQVLGFDRSEAGTTRILEQALEEEHAARAALYQELEKERSAAASAADEAMAMILRLQEEKAAIEMESRQYQRMIEEKSAYDAEEMNILKEILVRREREKHFLEKEVETYRLMMSTENEQVDSTFDFGEDPELMLQQISKSISKKEIMKNVNKSDGNVIPVEKRGRVLVFEEKLPISGFGVGDDILEQGNADRSLTIEKMIPHGTGCMDECRQEFQEKEMVSIKEHASPVKDQGLILEAESEFRELNQSQKRGSLYKTVYFLDEEQEKYDKVRVCQGMAVKNDHSRGETDTSNPCDDASLEKHENQDGRYQRSCTSEAEPSVLDVHVIDDKPKSFNQGVSKESGLILTDTTSDMFSKYVPSEASGIGRISVSSSHQSTNTESELDNHQISLVILDKSQGKSLHPDLRRNSMSAVDERLKLENEVGWLRERLKIVQEGREKLSFSVECQDREKLQLQLLEDIARQLQEIRQLTEPGRAVRQASLPPSSSKVSSKKRRCRSVSWGVHGSS